tara:strand:+ start:1988 stop:2359 length:372 start_codon:yes stop_codon:yes gene_type:complete
MTDWEYTGNEVDGIYSNNPNEVSGNYSQITPDISPSWGTQDNAQGSYSYNDNQYGGSWELVSGDIQNDWVSTSGDINGSFIYTADEFPITFPSLIPSVFLWETLGSEYSWGTVINKNWEDWKS